MKFVQQSLHEWLWKWRKWRVNDIVWLLCHYETQLYVNKISTISCVKLPTITSFLTSSKTIVFVFTFPPIIQQREIILTNNNDDDDFDNVKWSNAWNIEKFFVNIKTKKYKTFSNTVRSNMKQWNKVTLFKMVRLYQ